MLYDDELVEEVNTGPSFSDNVEEESIYDYYDDDSLTDEERQQWMDQFGDVIVYDGDERKHVDSKTGYEFVEGRKPHYWVEQDDGSWLCRICGEQKAKKKNKTITVTDKYEERTREAMRKNDEDNRLGNNIVKSKVSSSQKAIEDIWTKVNKKVESSSDTNFSSVESLTDDKTGNTDQIMMNMGKFRLDKTGVIRAKKYFQKQSCFLCGEDSEYNLAKYENGNGDKLCRYHLEERLRGDMDEDGKNNGVNYLQDVEKIVYGRIASIDPSRVISDPLMLNDMDKLFLQKRNREGMYSKIMKGTKLCESDKCEPREKAMYYVVYKNGMTKFLCKDHTEESFWKDGDEIRDIFKIYVKQWEDHELPEEKQSKRNISVVNVDMDQMDDEGSILIPTGEIAREMVRDRIMSSNEVPFLYRCSRDVAMSEGKGRYKIEDPKMIDERVLGAKSGADSRSGISVRHISSVQTNEESVGSYYFNLPRVNKIKTKQIVSYKEAEKLGVFYDYNIINDEIAKDIFQRFCKGLIVPRQLDKTVTGGSGSLGNVEDFEFWDNVFPFHDEETGWRHSRRRK